jgi:hypothetical protein
VCSEAATPCRSAKSRFKFVDKSAPSVLLADSCFTPTLRSGELAIWSVHVPYLLALIYRSNDWVNSLAADAEWGIADTCLPAGDVAAQCFSCTSSLAGAAGCAVESIAAVLPVAVDALLLQPQHVVADVHHGAATQSIRRAQVTPTQGHAVGREPIYPAPTQPAAQHSTAFSSHPDGHDVLSATACEEPFLSAPLLQQVQALTCMAQHGVAMGALPVDWSSFSTTISTCQDKLEDIYNQLAAQYVAPCLHALQLPCSRFRRSAQEARPAVSDVCAALRGISQ